jgi:hypothetical protein
MNPEKIQQKIKKRLLRKNQLFNTALMIEFIYFEYSTAERILKIDVKKMSV